MYLLIVPGIVWFVVFKYLPLLGNVAAFQNFSPFLGLRGSAWVGIQNFVDLFSDPQFVTSLRNTIVLSVLQIALAFPAPIGLALLLNSIMSERIRRIIQSVVYLPHFIGWVIVVSIWQDILGGSGMVNRILSHLGIHAINVMSNPATFKYLITGQVIWKEIGWGTIIFFAAIATIDQSLYEAAAVDGAGTWRRMWHITLPGIRGVIVLLLILRMGSVLSVGFEQIILQQASVGNDAGEVLDTFVYYRGIVGGDWGLSTAAGLFKGVIGAGLLIIANRFARRSGVGGFF